MGVPLLPKTIDCEDYENLRQQTDNKEILAEWYSLDEKAQPPCYVLQSIEKHIPDFEVSRILISWFMGSNVLLTSKLFMVKFIIILIIIIIIG